MSEVYVSVKQVLDLINITNAANGFSSYHAYLDLFDAVDNLNTIVMESDAKEGDKNEQKEKS